MMLSIRGLVKSPARFAAVAWMFANPLGAVAQSTPPGAAAQNTPPVAAPSGPAAPANVAIKPISATRLDVSWQDKSDNEDNFIVEVAPEGGAYASVGRAAENTTEFACTGLLPNTVYHVRVKATNSLGESAYAESPDVATYGIGKGLTGHYFHRYKDVKTLKPMFTRIDPYISFEWTDGIQNDTSVPEHNFLIVWTGQVTALYSETYTFYTEADDGARLWVDGTQLIDNWVEQAPTEKSGTIDLKAGQKYDVRLGYYENDSGGASIKFSWSSASQAKEIILPCQLEPKTAKEKEAAAVNLQARKIAAPQKSAKPGVKKKMAAGN